MHQRNRNSITINSYAEDRVLLNKTAVRDPQQKKANDYGSPYANCLIAFGVLS